MPDRQLFHDAATALIERACRQGPTRVRAYGEIGGLLWRNGNPKAAIRLEELWCDLQRLYGFSLLCAYVMANFYKEPAGLSRFARRTSTRRDRAARSRVRARPRPCAGRGNRTAQTGRARVRDSLSQSAACAGRALSEPGAAPKPRAPAAEIITDTLPVLVGYVDFDQRYRSVNVLLYEQWFGRPRGELIGLHVRDVLRRGGRVRAGSAAHRCRAARAHRSLRRCIRRGRRRAANRGPRSAAPRWGGPRAGLRRADRQRQRAQERERGAMPWPSAPRA